MAEVRMGEVEIKVTWRLAWSLWWRMMLISLGIWFIIWLIMVIAVGTTFLTW
jgi:hypothetical protein